MDQETRRRLEEYRRNQAGPVENALLDDLLTGEVDRREFFRRATIFGLSTSAIAAALAALGDAPLAFAAPAAVRAGGRLRVAIIPPPAKSLDPHTYADQGGLETGGIAGEFLTRATPSLTLLPELAVSWKPNADASSWTFKLRPNVKFQTGQTMTADDVVATYQRLLGPDSGALSAFKGVLSASGIKKIDDLTVQFNLDTPTASFPYLTSSTTYQAIVKTLFNGRADIGNDSPFAPVYPSTNKTVPQRKKDLRKAKQLMAAAGHRKGFGITLTTEQTGEIPQLAQIIQHSVKAININMKLNILTATAYFAGSQSGGPGGLGTTPWLNTPMNITDWGHRAVPNVLLNSALETGGVWNAA